MLYPASCLKIQNNHQTKQKKKSSFQDKRNTLLYFRQFQRIEYHFHYILRREVLKNLRIFCLDKRCSCYNVVDMFLNPGVFYLFQLEIC